MEQIDIYSVCVITFKIYKAKIIVQIYMLFMELILTFA